MNRRRLPVLLCVVLLSLTACANVPLETKPQAIRADTAAGGPGTDLAQPEKDLSPSNVVLAFVEQNAREADEYAASRLYLEPDAAKHWRPNQRVAILKDNFNTVPISRDELSDPDVTLVRLQGEQIGYLDPDNSFVPYPQDYDEIVQLRRQPVTKQWRITDPPVEVMTTREQFSENYFTTRLYFFAPGSDVLVPDVRYIPSRPSDGVAARVMDALLAGPSKQLHKAVDNPLHPASIDTNVNDAGSALEIPLTGVVDVGPQSRKRMVTQIVMSLETSEQIRVMSDGKPILDYRVDWRSSDLPESTPKVAGGKGLAVQNGKVVSLADGKRIPGPAGNDTYEVLSAAQSLEGGQLALVERLGKEERLRVGPFGKESDAIDIHGSRLTRPTWQPAAPGNKVSYEVWTVVNGKKVMRALLDEDTNAWSPQTVNTADLKKFGKITALRLSRDGTRAAIVAGGKLVVAAVVRSQESALLRAPRYLQRETLEDVTDVDWLEQDTLVVGTKSNSQPVVKVSVDGFTMTPYNQANLVPPVLGITGSPDGEVIAANGAGLWTAPNDIERWAPHDYTSSASRAPFYPG